MWIFTTKSVAPSSIGISGSNPVNTGLPSNHRGRGDEAVEVDDSGLPSNHRGRGVCPCELGHRQRDLQEIWGDHMTWDMLPRLGSIKYREKHDRMIQDVWQPVAHINLANTITT